VQPALFEALSDNFGGYDFGITDFATQFGGPLEIIRISSMGFILTRHSRGDGRKNSLCLCEQNLTIGNKFPRERLTGFTVYLEDSYTRLLAASADLWFLEL